MDIIRGARYTTFRGEKYGTSTPEKAFQQHCAHRIGWHFGTDPSCMDATDDFETEPLLRLDFSGYQSAGAAGRRETMQPKFHFRHENALDPVDSDVSGDGAESVSDGGDPWGFRWHGKAAPEDPQ